MSASHQFLSGINVIQAALHHARRPLHRLLVDAASSPPKPLIELAARRGVRVETAAGSTLERLAAGEYSRRELPVARGRAARFAGGPKTETRVQGGVVLEVGALRLSRIEALGPVLLSDGEESYECRISARESAPKSVSGTGFAPLWVALDRIQDPHNLGAILRNAHFFGVDGVIVTERESSPLSPTVSRASAGAMEAMDMYVTTNLSKLMERSDGWHVVGTAIPDLNSRTPASPIHSVKTRGPTIVVFGNEGEGLKPAVLRSCNELVWIPSGRARAVEAGVGMLDSLNVSVACGIVLSKLRGNEFLHGAGR